MAAGFRVRRIKSESSIGDKLKRARIRQKISIANVEEATKIRAKFISALECDSWDQIPSEVYGRGYLETYAQFLHLSVDSIMKQFSRERESYARRCRQREVQLTPSAHLDISRFLVTPRFFLGAGIGLVIVVLAGVLGMQVKAFAASPFLELQAPDSQHDQVFVTGDTYTVHGRTASGAIVQVNGKMVALDENGNFSEDVTLEKGVNAIEVASTNAKGKVTQEDLAITAN